MTAQNPTSKWWEISLVCLVLGVVFYRTSQTVADPDLWGHVRFGQDMWRDGEIATTDPYSYLTAGQFWINHEWLSELLFALVFNWSGTAGLVLLKTAISLVMAGLIYWHLSRQGMNTLRGGIVVIVVTFMLLPGLQSVRPQLFTYLFFLLILLIIHAAEHGGRRWLWFAPLVFALWPNFHGGFLAGIGVLFLWCGGRFGLCYLETRQASALWTPINRASCLTLIASMMATLLNPYGIDLWKFLLRTATVPRPDISEWQPLNVTSPTGLIYLIAVAGALAGILYSRRPRKPALLFLFACIVPLPLMANRHLQLFALALPVLVGEHLTDALDRWTSRRPSEISLMESRRPAWLAGLIFGAALMLVGLSLAHFRCVRLGPEVGFTYAARAVALLRESGITGNLAIQFNWGEYAIWHLGPQVKVSIDGRRETVYSDDIQRQNLQFIRGAGEWDALLERHETEMALVSKEYPVYNLMKLKPGWLAVYEDPLCGLFVREGSPLREKLGAAPPPEISYDGVGLCFP